MTTPMRMAGQASVVPVSFRLVASDLDGTLVRSDGTISERSVSALSLVERSGGTVVFVTGRPPRWMRAVAERTGHRGLAICANGAMVYDMHREQVVESFQLSAAVLAEAVERLRGELIDVVFAIERLDGMLREEAYVPVWDRHNPHVRVCEIDELCAAPAAKLLVRLDGAESEALLEHATEVLGDLVEITHSTSGGLLEISAVGVTKATTLARLASEVGAAAPEVLAFGDMPNDLPMLAWAGTAYAVANAHRLVLDAVPCHTASNDDDGVAQVIEATYK
jgi:Cof subfamily protein (haloacid dehalogenase superfamily)